MNANSKPLAKWLLYSSLIIVFISLALKLRLMTHADDVTFSHALDNTNLFDYLIHRYNAWSGRVIIEAIMISTITIHAFWKIMIPLCLVFSGYFLWSITLKETISRSIGVPLAVLAILLINSSVAGNAQWWVTGFYNYLLPVTCALFLLNCFLTPATKKPLIVLSILLSFIATSSEQVAIFLIICTPFIWTINKDSRVSNKLLSVGLIAIALGSTLTLLSPGSADRFYVEASRYMPQIIDMDILQRAIIGVDRLVENIAFNRNICFIAAVISLLAFIIKKGRNDWMNKACIIIATICLIACLTSLSFYMKDLRYVTYLGKFYSIDFGSTRVYGNYFFYLLVLISMGVGSIENTEGKRDYRAFIVILSGSVVTIAIGLSPTAYASDERVLYVFNISLIAYSFFNLKRAYR